MKDFVTIFSGFSAKDGKARAFLLDAAKVGPVMVTIENHER